MPGISNEQISRFRSYLEENGSSRLDESWSGFSDPAVRHVANLIDCCVRPSPDVKQFLKEVQLKARQQQKLLQQAISALHAAATAYKPLLTADHEAIMSMPQPANTNLLRSLPNALEGEADRLKKQLDQLMPRSQIKRLAEKSMYAFLACSPLPITGVKVSGRLRRRSGRFCSKLVIMPLALLPWRLSRRILTRRYDGSAKMWITRSCALLLSFDSETVVKFFELGERSRPACKNLVTKTPATKSDSPEISFPCVVR